MNILGIIPARYASTRFPGKPLADIGGKTMIRRVVEGASASGSLDDVVVATDDSRIFDHVTGFGGRAVKTGSHHDSGTGRCCEALDIWELQTGRSFDAVINIQGDEPFIQTDHIDKVAGLLKDGHAPIATLMLRITEARLLGDPDTVKVVPGENGTALYFSRAAIPFLRGVLPDEWLKRSSYYQHIGIYGFQSAVLRQITRLTPGRAEQAESLEQLRWLAHGFRIMLAETTTATIAIDTPDDLLRITNKP